MASIYDAMVLSCTKYCKHTEDYCPCLPYRLGDVPPRYPVPALAIDTIVAHTYNEDEYELWYGIYLHNCYRLD
jgi:hypothetical protein